MKTIAFSVLTAFLVNSTAFAQSSGFVCTNQMYREASLEVSDFSVEIKDSFPEGREEVGRVVEENLGLAGRISVKSVALLVDRADTQCEIGNSFEVTCSGVSKRARVLVEAYLTRENGVSGLINLTVEAELRDMNLTAKKVTNLETTATADLIVNGRPLLLKFETFFYPSPDAGGSSCKLL